MCIHTSVCASWQPDRQTDRQSQTTVRRVQSPFADTFLISASLCEAMCVHPRQVVHTYIHTCFSNSKLDPLACNRGHEQSASLSKLDPLVCTKQMTRSVNRLCSHTQVWYPPPVAGRACQPSLLWHRRLGPHSCIHNLCATCTLLPIVVQRSVCNVSCSFMHRALRTMCCYITVARVAFCGCWCFACDVCTAI